jgi:hypothetical protein
MSEIKLPGISDYFYPFNDKEETGEDVFAELDCKAYGQACADAAIAAMEARNCMNCKHRVKIDSAFYSCAPLPDQVSYSHYATTLKCNDWEAKGATNE